MRSFPSLYPITDKDILEERLVKWFLRFELEEC